MHNKVNFLSGSGELISRMQIAYYADVLAWPKNASSP